MFQCKKCKRVFDNRESGICNAVVRLIFKTIPGQYGYYKGLRYQLSESVTERELCGGEVKYVAPDIE